MKRIALVPVILIIVVIFISCVSVDNTDWIKPGDTFVFQGEEYTYNNAYSNEESTKIYLDITPNEKKEGSEFESAVGPIPKRAYAINSSKEEIYSPESWREDGYLQINVGKNTFVYGIVYEDKDGNLFYFKLVE